MVTVAIPRRIPVTEAAFLEACAGPVGSWHFDVDCDGFIIPMFLRKRRSPRLIIGFHGLIERKTRSYPYFLTVDICPEPSLISVCDPSLIRHPELGAAWYAGEETIPTQAILNRIFAAAIAAMGASRVVFFGSSVGGFAALYYSWQVPGSIAVAANPQTRVDIYRQDHRETYRRLCWPNLDPEAPISSVTTCDLVALYEGGMPNSVILLQSATDGHVRRHFAPFVLAIPTENWEQCLPIVLPWTHQGHAPPPPETYGPVLNTALTAGALTQRELTQTYRRLTRSMPVQSPSIPRPASEPAGPSAEDVRDANLARRLVENVANHPIPGPMPGS